MDRLERAHRLHKLLQERRTPVSLSHLCEALEGSERTVTRLIADMRDYLGAPILNRPGAGYFYSKDSTFELPGIWFSTEELYALLAIQQLTLNLSGGLFDDSIRLIQKKAESLLGTHMPSPEEIRRVHVLGTASRSKKLPMVPIITCGLLNRQRLQVVYHGRHRDERTEREISPQRLTLYRSNWYLNAWCHKVDGLRSFSMERIEKAQIMDRACLEVATIELDKLLASSFGIFSGRPVATAILHFSEQAARWVADEEWFPEERGQHLDDGTFELKVPYSDPTELIMDICRYGPDVEVISPPSLRQAVIDRLKRALKQYR
ncbi:MAG: YafY family protein [Mariprofundales bacterium]|nr:YafY family protein [Mariprofundales bacterium]